MTDDYVTYGYFILSYEMVTICINWIYFNMMGILMWLFAGIHSTTYIIQCIIVFLLSSLLAWDQLQCTVHSEKQLWLYKTTVTNWNRNQRCCFYIYTLTLLAVVLHPVLVSCLSPSKKQRSKRIWGSSGGRFLTWHLTCTLYSLD